MKLGPDLLSHGSQSHKHYTRQEHQTNFHFIAAMSVSHLPLAAIPITPNEVPKGDLG